MTTITRGTRIRIACSGAPANLDLPDIVTTIGEFSDDNDMSQVETLDLCIALERDGHATFGGGAAPLFTITLA